MTPDGGIRLSVSTRALFVLGVLAAPSTAFAVAAPPQCPWENVFGPKMVAPFSGAPVPENAVLWIRDPSPQAGVVELVDQTSGATVAVHQTARAVVSGGQLLEIEPDARLLPGHEYSVRYGTLMLGLVHTSTFTDELPPPAPQVVAAVPITSAYDPCAASGIIVQLAPQPSEVVLDLVESPDGSVLLELSGVPIDRSGIGMPAPDGTTVSFRVIAVDGAGNRSRASAEGSSTAGPVPSLPSKFPNDPNNPIDPTTGLPRGGCNCREAAGGGAEGALFALALAGLAAALRRRVGR